MLDVKCPVCGSTFEVGDNDKPIVDSRSMNGTAFLVPKCIGHETVSDDEILALARIKAKERYEEEFGSWEDADKYAKEDYVFAEYKKLKGDTNMNGESKTKTGVKKMSKKDERFEALRAAGFDVDKMLSSGVDLSQFIKSDDKVVEQIYTNGYVKNQKLHRRFITAQYLALCGWYDGTMSYDEWTKNFNENYDFNYQFDYMAKELHVLAKLEKSDKECFEERVQFFNKDVAIKLMQHYLDSLRKRIDGFKPRKCKGVPYIRYHGVDIFCEDIDKKIFAPLIGKMYYLAGCKDYESIEIAFNSFRKDSLFSKLPYDTQKCPEWVDAYKGAGAYFSALNCIRFNGCKVKDNDTFLDAIKSEEMLKIKAIQYKTEWWKLHAFVKKMFRDNNFNLKEVINKQ